MKRLVKKSICLSLIMLLLVSVLPVCSTTVNAAAKKYTITYVLNKGTNNAKNPKKYTAGKAVTLKNPTRSGYNFEGWYKNKKFTGSKVTKISKKSTGNKTFYAKWKKKKVVSAKVSYIVQNLNEPTKDPIIKKTIKSNLAETYGYDDLIDIEKGVSVLDVLVYAHKLKYGDAFTTKTCKTYLKTKVSDFGYGPAVSVEMMLGIPSSTAYSGFLLNNEYPSIDGIGTTVGTQVVTTGDVVDFFFYDENHSY